MQTFYSNGKLLLTAEYAVLDGATALALPTKFGQSLTIEPLDSKQIHWKSINHDSTIWFEKKVAIRELFTPKSDDSDAILLQLLKILNAVRQLNPNFLSESNGYRVTTKLGFDKNWGLGSSSTLINNIANWAKVDAYELLDLTFGGSGYDIACAQHNNAILYKKNNSAKTIEIVDFKPTFSKHLYFVYLNTKRNSRNAIETYRAHQTALKKDVILELNDITNSILKCNTLEAFCTLIDQHETVIAALIKEKPIKASLFSDFNGTVKSLGAWGGDFVLVASKEDPSDYFNSRGFTTILSFDDMIL